jgi:hypothetical protein
VKINDSSEDIKTKKSFALNNKNIVQILDKHGNNFNAPNQYAKLKIAAKGELKSREETDHSLKNQSADLVLMNQERRLNSNSDHNAHTSIIYYK